MFWHKSKIALLDIERGRDGPDLLGCQALGAVAVDQVHELVTRRRLHVFDAVSGPFHRLVRTRHKAVLAPQHHRMIAQRGRIERVELRRKIEKEKGKGKK